MSTSMQSAAQRWLIMLLPIFFIPFILNFPSGPDDLLADDEPVDDRPGDHHAPAHAAPGAAAEALEPDASARPRRPEPATRGRRRRCTRGARALRPAATGQAAKGAAQAMTEDEGVRVETTGETVGEAKWAALRELEQLVPGLDRDERRVRGRLRGRARPARRRLHAGPRRSPASRTSRRGSERARSAAAAREFVRGSRPRSARASRSRTCERDGVVTVTCSGADLGLLIGKHGQTIDAIQYLANAIVRSEGGEHEVVVDAAGYRARRTATLEAVAERAARRAVGDRAGVELDPMTSIERKIVHEALKEDAEVETESEGSEPNRYVVVYPRRPRTECAARVPRALARGGRGDAGADRARDASRTRAASCSTTLCGRCRSSRAEEGTVVDVGSGGGSPGHPARGRRCPLGRSCCSRPSAASATSSSASRRSSRTWRSSWGRAEEQPVDTYGVALAKALAKPPVAAELCLPLVRPGGAAILWVGRDGRPRARVARRRAARRRARVRHGRAARPAQARADAGRLPAPGGDGEEAAAPLAVCRVDPEGLVGETGMRVLALAAAGDLEAPACTSSACVRTLALLVEDADHDRSAYESRCSTSARRRGSGT